MSAKDQIKQIVDYFKKEPQLKDKTDGMAEGLLLGAQLADDANELSKETDASFKALQREYTENGNGAQTTAEITVARDGELVLDDRLKRDFGNVNAQLAQTESKKADYTYVDQQISRMSGGAIKGTYTTLNALKTAYPNGTVGPFLVEEDENRYIWDVNKLAWVSIGPYEPAELADESVNSKKIAKETLDTRHFSELSFLKKWVSVERAKVKTDDSWYNLQIDLSNHDAINKQILYTIKFKTKNGVNVKEVQSIIFANNNADKTVITGGNSVAMIKKVYQTDTEYAFNFTYTSERNLYRYHKVLIGFTPTDVSSWSNLVFYDIAITATIDDVDVEIPLFEITALPQYLNELNNFRYDFTEDYLLNSFNGATKEDANELSRRIDLINTGDVDITSKLFGKEWFVIGDSITQQTVRSNKNYHDFIAERTGVIVTNYGVSGTGFYDRYNSVSNINGTPDIITVFLGTNDWGNVADNNLPLGTFGDTTADTIAGRIYLLFYGLLNKFPTTPIGVITPLPRLENWGEDATPNAQGYTLKELVEMEIQYANHFSMPFLDLYRNSSLPVYIEAANVHYFKAPVYGAPDGLHPNDDGHEVISYKIEPWLASNLIK